MKKIRYLSLLTVLLTSVLNVWGQDDFNPVSPSEPGTAPTKLIVAAEPAEGGTVSGGGKYTPEGSVTVRAYANSNFRFVRWTDDEGNEVSVTSSYTFVKGYDTERLTAHFEFVPGSPAEPVPGEQILFYNLSLVSTEGGYVSGGGRYRPNTSVSLRASAYTNFDFVNWTNEEGEVVSEEMSFTYTTNAFHETITANFRFNPDSPAEPSDPVLRHKVNVTATDGGTVSSSASVVLKGSTVQLYAYTNDGYKFVGWFLDDVLYTNLTSFSYTMGDADVSFEARFEFNPDDPSEPTMPTDKKYAMYLMSMITYPGTVIDCPLYMTSLDVLEDMTFQLTFPSEVQPDWSTLALSGRMEGYTASVSPAGEYGVYLVSLIGGTLPAGTTQLLSLKVTVPETAEHNTSYQVKLNQVSVTEPNGATMTTSTRNGGVKVYKLGDTNGDGYVDIADKMNIVRLVVGEEQKTFLPEVSDVNEDGFIDVADGLKIINFIINGEE